MIVGLVLLFILAAGTRAAADDFANCDSNTKTISDIEDCAGAERDRAYSALETVYKKLIAQTTPQGQKKLEEARGAWEDYSKKQCAFETFGSKDAREHTMFVVLCYATMARDYTKKLDAQLHCTEGDLACGGQ